MRDEKNLNSAKSADAAEKRKAISSQALIGKSAARKAALANSKSDELFVKWMRFVHSPVFMALAILASAVLAVAAYGYVNVLESTTEKMLAGVQKYAMYFITGATSVLVIYGVLNVFGIWMHYTDAFLISRRRSWMPGLSLIIVTNRIMLGLVIAAFVVMLPLFVEWLPYDAANDLFLQLTYVALVLLGVWCAVVMVNAQKMREKLSLWCSYGNPMLALANAPTLRKKKKFDYIDVTAHLILILFSICILYPMLHVVAVAFSGKGPIEKNIVGIIPLQPTLRWCQELIGDVKYIRGFFNQVWYTVEGVAANLFFTALMAYPLSKTRLIGRSWIMKMCVFSMYFSGGLIPLYMQINSMGLRNSEWSWILAGLISTYYLIVMINGFQSIPESLYEAAYLDGASDIQVFFKIALPLSKATLASLGLFFFINHWNSWYSAMLYLDERTKYPLQLFMREILQQNQNMQHQTEIDAEMTPIGLKNALIVLTMIPVLIVYPFVQKYFVTGVMMGSVKG